MDKADKYDYLMIGLINTIPLIGVLALNWNIYEVFIIAVLESAIIGLFTLIKLWMDKGVFFVKFILTTLFVFLYYFIFCIGPLLFLISFNQGLLNMDVLAPILYTNNASIIIDDATKAAISLVPEVISKFFLILVFYAGFEAVSFFEHLKKKGRQENSLIKIFLEPFPKTFVSYSALILGGAFGLGHANMTAVAIIPFILLKTFFEVIAKVFSVYRKVKI